MSLENSNFSAYFEQEAIIDKKEVKEQSVLAEL